MDKAPLVADIVSTWLKHGAGRPTLCFAVNRIHAQHIRDKFEEAGVNCGYLDCFSTPPSGSSRSPAMPEGARKRFKDEGLPLAFPQGGLRSRQPSDFRRKS